MRNWDYMPSVVHLIGMPFINLYYPCDLMMDRIVMTTFSGVGTVMTLHMEVTDILKLRQSELKGTLVVAGHMACDSVGLDALGDVLRSNGLDVTPMRGVVLHV